MNEDNKDIDLSHTLDSPGSGVEFEEEKSFTASKQYRQSSTSKIIQLVMKYSGGKIKDEQHAIYVLIGLVVIIVILTMIIWPSNNLRVVSPNELPPPPPNFFENNIQR